MEIVDLRLWNTFLFVLCYFECRAEDSVDQLAGFLTASEGDSVTLPCTYTSSSTGLLYLFWYQQKPNGFPAYMLRRFSEMGDNDEGFKKRFEANLTSNSVPLTIQNLQVSDSAVYYCALRPTVADAHSTLIQKHQLASHTENILYIITIICFTKVICQQIGKLPHKLIIKMAKTINQSFEKKEAFHLELILYEILRHVDHRELTEHNQITEISYVMISTLIGE
ncbi:uncharacterized protein LOC121718610 [Alosa sapidissima]|uniref:uncharacterized protein LOC121718610 n=1 Tax=Alosa sapidissima TaxID=34773 RepID=UPI001C0A195F|nr:uncharacterized protein LOC121718610 [Alosa sapidissima]